MRQRPFALAGALSAAFLALLLPATARAADEPAGVAARRVHVLFLGDEGHHKPLERLRQIYSQFARRGIDFTYTDRLVDINAQNLARYDALLLYANIDKATPEAERAILDYVAAGHGYVVLHCGSYCFLNSQPLTALAGGRFKSHGTGVFKETIALADHPIERGLKPIESWDETYVHEMHNEQDRTVLGYRGEGDKREPYTWVRTPGKGRVFYTAWGHDERTWGNANFQDLVERGIRWAAGDWALAPRPAFKPFEYTDVELPNYQPGRPTGQTGGERMPMQHPVDPAESVKHMALPAGFEAKLFASDPDIKKPICMAWDERGRLWVSETVDYPNEMQRPGEGHDQITICEDTDGDGKADRFTVFADKLSIPTSICFANGGVIVAQAPDMLFLKDTDGDGKADVRQVLFTGWGTQDTHAGPSNLRWGFDNWIYGTVGYSGFKGTVGGQPIAFGQGLFRFKPDGSKIEFLASTTNNTWGCGLSEDGEIFASTANGAPSFYLHIPNRYYESVRGWSVRRLEPINDTANFYPLSEHVRQVDFHGAYTAGAGHALYTARTYPPTYWNRIAFEAEPTGHIVGQFVLQPDGSAYRARNDFNLLSSDDEWTAPIAAEVGPDGSVWVIDWYNFVVQHNPIPKGFEKGRGNAYVTPLRDKRHGRVYRLAYAGGTPSSVLDLSKAGPEQLVAALKSDNMFWRMHAQRLLVERGDRKVIPALAELAGDASIDAIGLNAPAVHALWTMHGLGAFDAASPDAAGVATAEKALAHKSAGVRKAAAGVLPRSAKSVEALLASKLLEDHDAGVRKAALLALSEMPASDAAGAAVYGILSRKENAEDRWMGDAATIAAARHDAGFLKAAFAAHAKGPAAAAPPVNPAGPAPAAAPAPVNLVPNPSFEDTAADGPKAWKPKAYGGSKAESDVAAAGHSGAHSARLHSDAGADAGWYVEVPVTPKTEYTLSGWIKTDQITPVGGGLGALFNVHNIQGVKTPAVTGTSDWKRVEVSFNSGNNRSVGVNCLLGGWGRAKGTAWYDDVELVPAGAGAGVAAAPGMAGLEGRVVEAVVNQYAQRGPADSVVATLSALKQTEPNLTAVVLAGIGRGWPKGTAVQLSDADAAELRAVMDALPPDGRDRLLGLADKWGRADLFAGQLAKAKGELAAAVADAALDAAKRGASARRLIAMDDGDATVAAVLKQITPAAPPDVQAELLDALSDSRNATVGKALVKQWGSLTPTAQAAALRLMLRRVPWAEALLAGVKGGTVNGKDLLPQQWQALTTYPDPDVAKLAKTLQASSGRAPTADRKAIVDKAMPLAAQTGDAKHGQQVFELTCMVCHTLEGKGGEVGPNLTGVGARPKGDILIDILDPNRSVEGTYRQWTAKTKEDVIAGRLSAESKTSIEIIDPAGQKHPIQRSDLVSLTASDRSVMPEGFEQLPPKDIADLLEFLATSKVKP